MHDLHHALSDRRPDVPHRGSNKSPTRRRLKKAPNLTFYLRIRSWSYKSTIHTRHKSVFFKLIGIRRYRYPCSRLIPCERHLLARQAWLSSTPSKRSSSTSSTHGCSCPYRCATSPAPSAHSSPNPTTAHSSHHPASTIPGSATSGRSSARR